MTDRATMRAAVAHYLSDISNILETTERLAENLKRIESASTMPGAGDSGGHSAGMTVDKVETATLEIMWARNALEAWVASTEYEVERAREIFNDAPRSWWWGHLVENQAYTRIARTSGYSVRHTHATWLLYMGVPVQLVDYVERLTILGDIRGYYESLDRQK